MARNFELPETKGNFQLKGIVTGVGRDGFYKDGTSTSGKKWRAVNFGLVVEDGTVLYLTLLGTEQDRAWFGGKEGDEFKTVDVEWSKRHTFKKAGYKIFGLTLGLQKDEEGKNDKKYLHQFDACKYISDNLEDGMSVFVRGNLEFGHFVTEQGDTVRTQKLVPTQISLLSSDIDFDSEKYEPEHRFTQDIIFLGIDKEGEEFPVEAHLVSYRGIETDTFVIRDNKLAKLFREKLKPYTKIQVHGWVTTAQVGEEVSEEDSEEVWGEENEMTKARTPYRRIFLVTGANPSTIDTENYTQKAIESAIEAMTKDEKAVSEFGSEEVWGEGGSSDTESDDEDW